MVTCTIARIGTFLWLFNMYNYTAVAFPTRIRSVAFAWTDGLGHLGAWAGVTLIGLLYGLGPNHPGWFLFIILPGALLPGLLIRAFGIKQAGAVLEQVSTWRALGLGPALPPWREPLLSPLRPVRSR